MLSEGQEYKKRIELTNTTRDESIDIVRGICIVYMIMGHIGFGSLFSKYIHAFHVPIFFLISGYFYSESSFLVRLKRKFSSLIVPFIVFGLFHLLVYCALEHVALEDLFTGKDPMLYHLLVMNSLALPVAGALWFLVALFVCCKTTFLRG